MASGENDWFKDMMDSMFEASWCKFTERARDIALWQELISECEDPHIVENVQDSLDEAKHEAYMAFWQGGKPLLKASGDKEG